MEHEKYVIKEIITSAVISRNDLIEVYLRFLIAEVIVSGLFVNYESLLIKQIFSRW